MLCGKYRYMELKQHLLYHIYQGVRCHSRISGPGGKGEVGSCSAVVWKRLYRDLMRFYSITPLHGLHTELSPNNEVSIHLRIWVSLMCGYSCMYICRGRPCTYTNMCICPWPNCYGIAGERANQFLTTEI